MALKENKKILCAAVVSNRQIQGRYRQITFSLDENGGKAFRLVRPGQFAQFDLTQTAAPAPENIDKKLRDASKRMILLRRPLSFSNVIQKPDGGVYLEVLYSVVGPATVRMSGLQPGQVISVIGPLGNGFRIPENLERAVLAAGGMGTPPIIHLARFLTKQYPQIEFAVLVGAKSKDDLPLTLSNGEKIFVGEFIKTPFLTATDDGSAGFRGFVSQLMEKFLNEHQNFRRQTIVYACGPEQMLAATAAAAKKFGLPCQVSMERMMACGIGLCQSCAIESAAADGYKLCCKDGPVFDADKVRFQV